MDTLRGVIRGIALMIIFAGFLEMLLPDNEMRKYIQVVVGLFVIVTVVTPIVQMVDLGKSMEVTNWNYTPADNTKQIIENGRKISEIEKKNISAEEEKKLIAQVSAISKLHEAVEDAKVEINQSKIKIHLIFQQNTPANKKKSVIEHVTETISAFFGYPAENIEVGY